MASIASIVSRHGPDIARRLDRAIFYTLANTAYAVPGVQPTEPDYIADLALHGGRRIGSVLGHRLSPNAVNVFGVFCHGKPEVKQSGQAKGCELGDWLICHMHRTARGVVRRNALLLQAKKAPAGAPVQLTSRPDLTQLNLYSKWPQFTYTRTINLTGQTRQVTAPVPHAGAQYLLLDDSPFLPPHGLLPYRSLARVAMAQNPLPWQKTLGAVIVESLIGLEGRPFQDQATARLGTGWSRVVWDLLDIAFWQQFNRKRFGHHNRQRGFLYAEDGVPRLLTALAPTSFFVRELEEARGISGDGSPPDVSTDSIVEDEPGAVSVMVIETTGSDDSEE